MLKNLVIVIPNNNIQECVNSLKKQYDFFDHAFDANILKLVTIPWIDAYIDKDYDRVDTHQVLASNCDHFSEIHENSLIPFKNPLAKKVQINGSENVVLQKLIREQEIEIQK